jgi:hypothetical protein
MRVPETGGVPVAVTSFPPDNQLGAANPSFLPDGRHFVYIRGSAAQSGIYLGSLDLKPEQQDTKPLVTVPFPNRPVYAASTSPDLGYVLFTRNDSLMALPLDLRRWAPAGPAIPLAEGVSAANAPYAASSTGVLAFLTGSSETTANSQLLWFDRAGKQVGQLGPPGAWADTIWLPMESWLWFAIAR